MSEKERSLHLTPEYTSCVAKAMVELSFAVPEKKDMLEPIAVMLAAFAVQGSGDGKFAGDNFARAKRNLTNICGAANMLLEHPEIIEWAHSTLMQHCADMYAAVKEAEAIMAKRGVEDALLAD